MTKNAHLALIYDERVPSDFLSNLCLDIETKSLDFRRQSLPPRDPQASLDMLALTAIAFFLLKPYFDSFMKEAGKDHYVLLKKTLKKLWGRFFSKDKDFHCVMITSSGEVKLEHSLLFSIYAEINNGRKVKFLIHEGCSKDNFAAGIDAFFDLVESYHSDVPYEGIVLDDERDYWGVILIEFDPETKSLRVLDPTSRSRKKHDS